MGAYRRGKRANGWVEVKEGDDREEEEESKLGSRRGRRGVIEVRDYTHGR